MGQFKQEAASQIALCLSEEHVFFVRNVLLPNVGFESCRSLKVEVCDRQWSTRVVMSPVPQMKADVSRRGEVLRESVLGLHRSIIHERLIFKKETKRPWSVF